MLTHKQSTRIIKKKQNSPHHLCKLVTFLHLYNIVHKTFTPGEGSGDKDPPPVITSVS